MCFPLVLLLVGQLEYHPVQVVLKGLVLCVLPVELRVVPEHRRYLPLQGHCRENPGARTCRAWNEARKSVRVLHREARRIAKDVTDLDGVPLPVHLLDGPTADLQALG